MSDLTLSEHLIGREDFLHIHATPSSSGSGWDVVLRIDGTYADKDLAEAVADGLRKVIVPPPGAIWWNGAPWKR